MKCTHQLRNEMAGQNLWFCPTCYAIGRDEEVLFTAVESSPMPSRWDLEDEIARLQVIVDEYEKDKV